MLDFEELNVASLCWDHMYKTKDHNNENENVSNSDAEMKVNLSLHFRNLLLSLLLNLFERSMGNSRLKRIALKYELS